MLPRCFKNSKLGFEYAKALPGERTHSPRCYHGVPTEWVSGGPLTLNPSFTLHQKDVPSVRYSGSRGITDQQSQGEGRNLAPNCQSFSMVSPQLPWRGHGKNLVRRAHLFRGRDGTVSIEKRSTETAQRTAGWETLSRYIQMPRNDGPMVKSN
jgi:hypothetical protein